MSSIKDKKNKLSCWVSKYNGNVYAHFQQQYGESENKKRKYCFIDGGKLQVLESQLNEIYHNNNTSTCVEKSIDTKCNGELEIRIVQTETGMIQFKCMNPERPDKPVSLIEIVDVKEFLLAVRAMNDEFMKI